MIALLLGLALTAAAAAAGPAPAKPTLQVVASAKAFAALPAFHAKGLHVVHFWASWCEPCRMELPEYLARAQALAAQGVDFTFISVDAPEDADPVAAPFMAGLGGFFAGAHQLVLSPDVDPDQVTARLSKTWSGEIPTTFVFRDGKKVGEFHGEAEAHALEHLTGPARRSSPPRPRRAR